MKTQALVLASSLALALFALAPNVVQADNHDKNGAACCAQKAACCETKAACCEAGAKKTKKAKAVKKSEAKDKQASPARTAVHQEPPAALTPRAAAAKAS